MKKRYMKLGVKFLITLMCIGLTTVDSDALFSRKGEKYDTKKVNTLYEKTKSTDEYYRKEYIENIKSEAEIKSLKKKSLKKYEVAIAHKNGDYSYISATNDLEQAVNEAKVLEKSKTSQGDMYVVIDQEGFVTYAPQSIARSVAINLGGASGSFEGRHTAIIYPTSTSRDEKTYLNSASIDDMPIVDEANDRVKVEVAGYTGWIKVDEWVEIDEKKVHIKNIDKVPLNQVENLSYYTKDNKGNLVHYVSNDITNIKKGGEKIISGVAPQFMKPGTKYYSYDANYFYTDIKKLLLDAENNNHNNAINKDADYNYYNHLPIRTKTSYTVNDIDKYINNNTPSKSVLRGKGDTIIDAQNKYGVNASLILAVAMHESEKGTSRMSYDLNNVFGLKAFDVNPGENALKFKSVDDCIESFAKNWMSFRYANPKFTLIYNGGSLGNKSFGVNVKYASDPYWSEKVSYYMYEMDQYLGGDEYNKYELGVYTDTNTVTNKNNEIMYEIKNSRSTSGAVGDVVAIVDEASDKYQVNADRPISVNLENFYGDYTWEDYYINKDNVKIINTPSDSHLNQDQINVINKFEQFYIYGPFTDPITDLSNDDDLITSYKEAVGILRTTENGKVYDRQRFIDAWNNLTSEEKKHPKMIEIYNEYEEIISIAEAAKACFEFFDNIKSNANNLKLDRLSAIQLNSKDNLYNGTRGKAYKEYMEAVKLTDEDSKNSKRMKHINGKYLDALRFLNSVDNLIDNEVDDAKSEANKISDFILKNIANKNITDYCKKYNYDERQVIDRFERFYIYGSLENPIIDLSDKNNLITSYSQANGILKTTVSGKKYDRQYFLDAWNKLSSSEKSSSKMKEVIAEYKKIVSISEAGKYCFEFFDNISSNANELKTDRLNAIKLNSKENLEDGTRGKAYKEYIQATKHGENSKNSNRMNYINGKYVDALRFLNAVNYMVDNEIEDAKLEAYKINDKNLKDISINTITSYDERYTHNQMEAFDMLERFFVYGPLDDMVINLLDKDDTIDTYSQAVGILKTEENGKEYDRLRAERALETLSSAEAGDDPIMEKYWNEFYKVIEIAEAAKACYKFFDDVSKNANTLIKDHKAAINLNSKDNMKFGARGNAYEEYMQATEWKENSKNSGRMKAINSKYLDAVYFLNVSKCLGENDEKSAKSYVSKIKDSKLKSIASKSI